jgi:hypothetical protein
MYNCVHTQVILSLIYFSEKFCLCDTSACYTNCPRYGHRRLMWVANDKVFLPCVKTSIKQLHCMVGSRAVVEESCWLLGELVSTFRNVVLLSRAGPSRRRRAHPDDDSTKFLRRVENRRHSATSSAAPLTAASNVASLMT